MTERVGERDRESGDRTQHTPETCTCAVLYIARRNKKYSLTLTVARARLLCNSGVSDSFRP
jgi:hypothetical protein